MQIACGRADEHRAGKVSATGDTGLRVGVAGAALPCCEAHGDSGAGGAAEVHEVCRRRARAGIDVVTGGVATPVISLPAAK